MDKLEAVRDTCAPTSNLTVEFDLGDVALPIAPG